MTTITQVTSPSASGDLAAKTWTVDLDVDLDSRTCPSFGLDFGHQAAVGVAPFRILFSAAAAAFGLNAVVPFVRVSHSI